MGFALAVAAAALVFPASLRGQSGSVSGVVRGPAGGLAGAVVSLVSEGPSTTAVPEAPVWIDQRRLQFIPDAVVVTPGRSVAFRNSDPLLHNIFSPDPLEPFDLGTYPEGESRAHRFERPGPHVILCNIHPEMEAWVYVAPTEHAVTADEAGRFRVGPLPAGPYVLRVWYRRAGSYEQAVRVRPGEDLRIEVRLGSTRPGGGG